jgi:hypothetical protein
MGSPTARNRFFGYAFGMISRHTIPALLLIPDESQVDYAALYAIATVGIVWWTFRDFCFFVYGFCRAVCSRLTLLAIEALSRFVWILTIHAKGSECGPGSRTEFGTQYDDPIIMIGAANVIQGLVP